MFLEHLDLKNFRAFDTFQCDFSDTINLIYGANGQGKTAVLEAIHVLSLSRTFRSGMQMNIMRHGESELAVQGLFRDDSQREHVIRFATHMDRKRIQIDQKTVERISQLIGVFPVVVMSPEHAETIRGGARVRRSFIDRLLSVTDSSYLVKLKEYQRVLKQRNALLANAGGGQLSAWSSQLAEAGVFIWRKRLDFSRRFGDLFREFRDRIVPDTGFNLDYPNPECPSAAGFMSELECRRETELRRGHSVFGPHRDDWHFLLKDRPLRDFGSQGEQKLFLSLLKKTEAGYIEETMKRRPLVLLDDMFAMFDSDRSRKVLTLFIHDFQTVMTSTDQNVKGLLEESEHPVHSIWLR